MNRRVGSRVVAAVFMIAAAAIVGFYAYNLGVAHGVAESARIAVAPGTGVPVVAYWPRPWGFGFGFFPFFFILFWFFVLRGLFWRGPWGGWGWRHDGVPPAFEEWHRRAHAQSGKSGGTEN